MKKLLALMALGMALLALPLVAQADQTSPLNGIEAKIDAFKGFGRADVEYDYGVVVPYVANDTTFWTGLAVNNMSSDPALLMIGVFDTSGQAVAYGEFGILDNGLYVEMLDRLADQGVVPPQSSLAIFSTEDFAASVYVGSFGLGYTAQLFNAEPY